MFNDIDTYVLVQWEEFSINFNVFDKKDERACF